MRPSCDLCLGFGTVAGMLFFLLQPFLPNWAEVDGGCCSPGRLSPEAKIFEDALASADESKGGCPDVTLEVQLV